MKEGEEEKTKSYMALVWTNKAIQREDLSFMDDIKVQATDTPTYLLQSHFNTLKIHVHATCNQITSWLKSPRCSGSDSEPEDAPEGSAPASPGGASEGHPQHEHQVCGPSPLLPWPEDAGRDVSSHLEPLYCHHLKSAEINYQLLSEFL